jgi:hypothetical protein
MNEEMIDAFLRTVCDTHSRRKAICKAMASGNALHQLHQFVAHTETDEKDILCSMEQKRSEAEKGNVGSGGARDASL